MSAHDEQNAAIPAAPALTRAEVVDAIFSTLEMLIPHAARVVEEKTQALVERIEGLTLAAKAQENNIAQMVACVQHLRLDSGEISIDDLLNRTQVSLTFTIEHNLEFSRNAQVWSQDLGRNIAVLEQAAEDLKNAQSGEQASGLLKSLKVSISQLRQLRETIASSDMDGRERELYRQDLKSVAQILHEQPARTRQMQALLEGANSTARLMAEHTRETIMAIQFQDYNSQLAENAARLLRILRQNVTAVDGGTAEGEGERLLNSCRDVLTLGEIRHLFLQNLKQHPDMDRGYHDLEQGAIELF